MQLEKLQNNISAAPLRKLLQSRNSRQFLTKDNGWTDHVQLAAVFPDASSVIAAIEQRNLPEVDVYYAFFEQESRYDFTISLQ